MRKCLKILDKNGIMPHEKHNANVPGSVNAVVAPSGLVHAHLRRRKCINSSHHGASRVMTDSAAFIAAVSAINNAKSMSTSLPRTLGLNAFSADRKGGEKSSFWPAVKKATLARWCRRR
jgi:hypothetical protein